MRPPRLLRRAGRGGVLLVEAVLSAVAIAVGLVWITRSLSNQLKALRTVEDYATLTHLAQQALLEMERDVQAGLPPRRAREGTFDPPYAAYHWVLNAEAFNEQSPALPTSVVRLSLRRATTPSSTVVIQAVWPSDLVPPEWFQ